MRMGGKPRPGDRGALGRRLLQLPCKGAVLATVPVSRFARGRGKGCDRCWRYVLRPPALRLLLLYCCSFFGVGV